MSSGKTNGLIPRQEAAWVPKAIVPLQSYSWFPPNSIAPSEWLAILAAIERKQNLTLRTSDTLGKVRFHQNGVFKNIHSISTHE